MRKQITCLLLCLSMAFSFATVSAAAAEPAEVIVLTARQEGSQLFVKASVSDLTFNAMQLVLSYDEEQLAPSNYENNSAAGTVKNMTRYLVEPYDLYDNPEGWMENNGSALNSKDSTVQYIVSVAPGAAGEAADEEGYVSLKNTDLFEMSFQIKKSSLTGSCLKLGSTPSVPEGIIISAKDGDKEVDLVKGSAVRLDLSAVVKEESGGNGGNSGGNGSGGSGDHSGGSGSGSGSGGSSSTGDGTGGSNDAGGNPTTTGGAVSGKPGADGVTPSAVKVTDVEGHWAKSSIETLLKRGIVSGYENGTFLPENPLTRGEFATVMAKTKDLKDKNETVIFADCAGHWAAGAINACYGAGYVSGTGAGTFSPDQPITREEIVTILAKAEKLAVAEELAAAEELAFRDSGSIAEWARPYVASAVKAGLVGGYEDNSFRPANNVTRGEMAQILVQTLN